MEMTALEEKIIEKYKTQFNVNHYDAKDHIGWFLSICQEAVREAKIEENKHLEKIVSNGYCDGIGSEIFLNRIKELKEK